MAPMEINYLNSLEDFKNTMIRVQPDVCDCELCKDFVSNLGYINFI